MNKQKLTKEKCINCGIENKGNNAENLQGYCTIQCQQEYYAKMKLVCVKNTYGDIECEHEALENRMTLSLTLSEVSKEEFEKLRNFDRYTIFIDPLRNKVKFEMQT
jgi:hypothetical protein